MTTLDAYARFLAARWDEMDPVDLHAHWCEYVRFAGRGCDCDHPAYVLADLAAKRAILDDARNYSPELEHGDSGEWAFGVMLEHLAAPFRDHPGHPANGEG